MFQTIENNRMAKVNVNDNYMIDWASNSLVNVKIEEAKTIATSLGFTDKAQVAAFVAGYCYDDTTIKGGN